MRRSLGLTRASVVIGRDGELDLLRGALHQTRAGGTACVLVAGEGGIGKTGLKAGSDVYLALDVASSELWAGNGRYTFKKSGEADRTSEQMVRLFEDWLRQYPIASIEDGVAEGDGEGWKMLTATL